MPLLGIDLRLSGGFSANCSSLPAGGDHLGGVLEAGVGDLFAAEHAGDFVVAGAVIEGAYATPQ